MRFIAERTSDLDLTPDLVRELHGILIEGTLEDPSVAGRFRRYDEQIVVQDIEGKILHAPPPAAELPGRLQMLCDFANDATYFLLHQMRIILRAIDDLHTYLDRKMGERRRSLEMLKTTAASSLGPRSRSRSMRAITT
jgi:hypothetical protein